MRSHRQTSRHGNIAHPVLLPAGEDGYFIRLDAVRNRLVCLERQLRIPHLRPFAQTAEGIQRTEAITIERRYPVSIGIALGMNTIRGDHLRLQDKGRYVWDGFFLCQTMYGSSKAEIVAFCGER